MFIKGFLTTCLGLAVLPGTYYMKAADTNLPAIRLLESKRPLVIGHRGYCQFAPENTLPSFSMAVAAGADLVELDYHHTKDGKLLVMHDAELDRTTDATNRWHERHVKIVNKTAAEIQTLDAGKQFDPKYAGTKAPLLSEALDTIQKGSVTLIERKVGDAAACIQLLKEKDLINKVVVQAFDWSYLKDYHQQEPSQILGALGPPNKLSDGSKPAGINKALNSQWLDDLVKAGASVAVWNDKVSKEVVAEAHKRGLKVWCYTINDSDLANHLLDMGVDGIISNNTSLIWRTVALRHAGGV